MLLVVGRVLRPHGIRGEVMVEVRTDDPGQRFAQGRVLATQPQTLGPLTVASARPHAGGLIVGFAEVGDRGAANQLRGALLVIESADVPAPDDPDEFHDSQLIGLDVRTMEGRRVGRVADVRHHGQDLLVIHPGRPAGDAGRGGQRPPRSATRAAGVGHRDERPEPSAAGGDGGPAPGTAPGPAQEGRPGLPQGRQGGGDDREEILVPFVAAIVREVDLAAGRLLIDPPPGLLDDHERT